MPQPKKPISHWIRSGLQEYMNIPHKSADLFLSYCGIEQCHPGHSYDKQRAEYHLHIVLSGHGTYEFQGQHYALARGDMFLVLPKTTYVYTADLDDPWQYAWIGVNGTKARQYLSDSGFSNDIVTRKSILAPEVYLADIQAMLDCDPLSPSDELVQLSHLYHYLSLLIQSQAHSEPAHTKTYEQVNYVNTAVLYMRENYTSSEISVASTAAALHIDVSYLYRLFQDALQCSPLEYLTDLRMQRACQLLSSTHEPVREIAAMVGYKDAFTFSKCFSRTYEISPREYRKAHSHLAT